MSGFASQVRGTKTGRSILSEESDRVGASRLVRVYENHEFLLPSPVMDESIRTVVDHVLACTCARASGAFGRIVRGQRISIRNVGTATVHFRLEHELEGVGDIYSLDSLEYQDWDWVEYDDLLLTNLSGVAVPVRIGMG